jgi:hypothetical protein
MSCLTEALRYADRGWPIIPVHTAEGAGCSSTHQGWAEERHSGQSENPRMVQAVA